MKRQRGQSAVEFALISPIIFLMIFAAIYGGAMFIQFMNMSNQARAIAREIAVADENYRQTLMKKNTGVGLTSDGKFAGIYKVTLNSAISDDGKDVVVTVNFDRGEFPFGFPPAHFALRYTMILENDSTDTATNT